MLVQSSPRGNEVKSEEFATAVAQKNEIMKQIIQDIQISINQVL